MIRPPRAYDADVTFSLFTIEMNILCGDPRHQAE